MLVTLISMTARSSMDDQILKVKKPNIQMQSLIKFSEVQMNDLFN